jgi:hypothetical protein
MGDAARSDRRRRLIRMLSERACKNEGSASKLKNEYTGLIIIPDDDVKRCSIVRSSIYRRRSAARWRRSICKDTCSIREI